MNLTRLHFTFITKHPPFAHLFINATAFIAQGHGFNLYFHYPFLSTNLLLIGENVIFIVFFKQDCRENSYRCFRLQSKGTFIMPFAYLLMRK